MAEWLILRLPPTPESPTQWLLADSQGQPLAQVQSGTLADAAARLGGRRVCALVPGGDVLVTDVELPARAGARAQQLVPYALEEQLAADVETLHFALGPTAADSHRTRVAVVARALMDQWLAMLRSAHLNPSLLCPESALLPVNPGQTVVLLEAGTLCLRRPDGSAPLILPADDMAGGMAALLGAGTLAIEPLVLYADSPEWPHYVAAAEALRERCASLTVQLLGSGPLPLLAPQLPQAASLNLLQGGYAPQTDHGTDPRRWQLAVVLAAALLLLHIAGQAFSLWRLDRTERRLDAAIQQTVTRYVPGDPGTGDVRARLQQRLLSGEGGTDGLLLRALGAVARAQGSAGNLALETLTLHSGALQMKVRAANADSLEHLIQALHGGGWQADLTSGAAVGAGGYEGNVTLSPGSGTLMLRLDALRLDTWYASLQPRERRFVVIGAIAAVLLIFIVIVMPLQRACAAAGQRVEQKRADLAWVGAVAPQLSAAPTAAAPSPAPSLHESLVVVLDHVARESGLAASLGGSQPSGDGGLSIRVQQASFDTLVSCLSQLGQRYGVSVESATIDSTATPGIVNASLVLRAR